MTPVRKTVCGEDADAGKRLAEEGDGGACLQRDDGAMIDISPVEMLSAEDVVHFVAEVAPADVRFPEIRSQVKCEFEKCKESCEQEGLPERAALRCDCGVFHRGDCIHSLRGRRNVGGTKRMVTRFP
jgi:hypothetical protein